MCNWTPYNVYPMSVTQLATHAEFVGGRIKVQSPQNTLLKRDEDL